VAPWPGACEWSSSAIWSPGEVLAIDWGEEILAGRKVHVFCAVLAWSRFRFVRFAADEQQATTLAMLAECFEVLGGVPKVVLADRMGRLKGGVVANVVVPSPDYVRFATHYRFRPDFCHPRTRSPRASWRTWSATPRTTCWCHSSSTTTRGLAAWQA